jgi:soluble lytic murein transglycosylase-like protein
MDTRSMRALLAALLLASSGPAVAGRQLCRFPDGEERVVYQNLGSAFGLTVSDCRPLPPARDEPEPVRLRVVEAQADVRVIRAPPAWPLPAPIPRVANDRDAPAEYRALIARAARTHGVDPSIVEAVMYVESRFQSNARSDKGAIGLMQLMPQTAAQYGVRRAELLDPAVNIDCGTRYLGELSATFAGRLDLLLAAYNAGPGAVMKHGWRVPPFAETRDYVERVLQRIRSRRQ